jgi:VWFA-related protein
MLVCAAQGQVTIRVPVRLITAPTLVFTEDGRLIPDLKTADFRLYDNDRLQKISLETASSPVSVVMAVDTNPDVRAYLPFIAKVGSVVETLVAGEGGESALITYNNEVKVVKPFASGDLQQALRGIAARGYRARSIDAGMHAIRLLRDRPPSQSRVLLFVGQPIDDGSESTLAALQEEAEKANVTIFALALPEIGKNFVSDTFTLQGLPQERGGYIAGTDLLKLVSVVSRTIDAAAGSDPFTTLTAATGGTLLHFRKQAELEGVLAAVGVQLRSSYLLSYYANAEETGRHTIRVEVNVPGAKAHTRAGW